MRYIADHKTPCARCGLSPYYCECRPTEDPQPDPLTVPETSRQGSSGASVQTSPDGLTETQHSAGKLADLIEEGWQELLDKDDRTSPEDYPDMCLITRGELADLMGAACLRGRFVGQQDKARPADLGAFLCGYVACERGHNIQEAERRFRAGEVF